MTETVDMWCIVHDGSLLVLLANLLVRSRAWSKCELRVYFVASKKDNTINLRKEVKGFVIYFGRNFGRHESSNCEYEA